MLRSLVLVLMLVNAGFYAWSHGWLNDVVGIQPEAQHEPQRLSQQVHADQLIVVAAPPPPAPASTVATSSADEADSAASKASDVSTADATDTTPKREICVEAGPFTAAEQVQVETALKTTSVPPKLWTTDNVAVQGLWLVYMGPYADTDVLARKLTELRRIKGLSFEEIHTPANLAPGLSLGRYSRLEEANAALANLKLRGIRTAHIVTLRAPMELQVVRVTHADVNTQVMLSGVKLPQGKVFTACRS
jgi:hypothetical protein